MYLYCVKKVLFLLQIFPNPAEDIDITDNALISRIFLSNKSLATNPASFPGSISLSHKSLGIRRALIEM